MFISFSVERLAADIALTFSIKYYLVKIINIVCYINKLH